jgi:hypothetical protein
VDTGVADPEALAVAEGVAEDAAIGEGVAALWQATAIVTVATSALIRVSGLAFMA